MPFMNPFLSKSMHVQEYILNNIMSRKYKFRRKIFQNLCTYSRECIFSNPAPKGCSDTSNRHMSPQLLAEYVQYHFINSTDIHSSIVGSLHAMHCAVCSVYCHFPSIQSACKAYLFMLHPTAGVHFSLDVLPF